MGGSKRGFETDVAIDLSAFNQLTSYMVTKFDVGNGTLSRVEVGGNSVYLAVLAGRNLQLVDLAGGQIRYLTAVGDISGEWHIISSIVDRNLSGDAQNRLFIDGVECTEPTTGDDIAGPFAVNAKMYLYMEDQASHHKAVLHFAGAHDDRLRQQWEAYLNSKYEVY